jgi:BRCT domain type II-containing protein
MNNKQLIKVIKTLVEVETAKQQERFLSKTFPKILAEEVNKRLKEVKGGVAPPSTQVVSEGIDPFQQVELALEQERATTTPTKKLSNNPILNEVLNQTKPFSKAQRSSTPGGGKSVLDTLPQQEPIQESMDKTVEFTSQGAGAGVGGLRTQMAHKMGYGDVATKTNKTGLGVRTGLPGLDKILNRDNSTLVKKFKTR